MPAKNRSLALAFGLLLAGGVLIERGGKAAAQALQGGGGASGGVSPGKVTALPGGAMGQLNSNQQVFAQELSSKTGLDPTVVAAWIHAEEPPSAAHAPNGANNWLNIGAVDSGAWAGGTNSFWNDPVAAADATAQWLTGANMPGFGSASSGIRAILNSVSGGPQAQIHAIQNSGWASSGYPDLPSIYSSMGGH